MNGKRWWLALFYVLATLVAQGGHHHGGADESAVGHHDPECADACPHVAGHPSPDLGHAPDHCLACQFRAQHHSYILACPTLERPDVSVSTVSSHAPVPSRTLSRISCRAPPGA